MEWLLLSCLVALACALALAGLRRNAKRYEHMSRVRLVVLGALRTVHWVVLLYLCTYALLQPERDVLMDMAYLALASVVMVHWLFFKNECVLNYLDAKLVDCRYRLGDAPYHNPFIRDVMGGGGAKAVSVVEALAYTANLYVVLARNSTGPLKYYVVSVVGLYMLVQMLVGTLTPKKLKHESEQTPSLHPT